MSKSKHPVSADQVVEMVISVLLFLFSFDILNVITLGAGNGSIMKQKIVTLFALTLLLSACGNNAPEENIQMLLGDWHFEK